MTTPATSGTTLAATGASASAAPSAAGSVPASGATPTPATNSTLTTSSTTSTTPGSVTTSTLPAFICKRVIFKRVHEKKLQLATNMTFPPLSEDELKAGPDVNWPAPELKLANWYMRLKNTPLSEDELKLPPDKQTDIWRARRERTALSDDEWSPVPPIGTPEYEVWRDRAALCRGEDEYGHWWVEIYSTPDEYSMDTLSHSYGYWPMRGVDMKGTVRGVPGAMNRGDSMDPHADINFLDWLVHEYFHPEIPTTDEDGFITTLKKFADEFAAKKPDWAYPATFGTANCQSFQEDLIAHLKKECGMTGTKIPVGRSKITPPISKASQMP